MPTSDAKVTANRANALASTGPQTAAGKRRSSANATRHGLRSAALVVPGREREADWRRHLSGVLSSLQPADYLEACLAADVAATTWRLARAVRHENDLAAVRQEEVEEEVARALDGGDLEGHRAALVTMDQTDALVARWPRWPADELVPPEVAMDLLGHVLDLATTDRGDAAAELWLPEEAATLEALACGLEEPFPADRLRQVVETVARELEEEPDELVATARLALRGERRGTLRRLAALETKVDRLRRVHSLPTAPELDKVVRYEAHLRRSLGRSLADLRDLQERRATTSPEEA